MSATKQIRPDNNLSVQTRPALQQTSANFGTGKFGSARFGEEATELDFTSNLSKEVRPTNNLSKEVRP